MELLLIAIMVATGIGFIIISNDNLYYSKEQLGDIKRANCNGQCENCLHARCLSLRPKG